MKTRTRQRIEETTTTYISFKEVLERLGLSSDAKLAIQDYQGYSIQDLLERSYVLVVETNAVTINEAPTRETEEPDAGACEDCDGTGQYTIGGADMISDPPELVPCQGCGGTGRLDA